MPAVKSRADLFHPGHLDRWYTLERYHMMGSRILSRSFQVEPWDSSEDETAPRVDMYTGGNTQDPDETEEEQDGDSDSEDHEDPSDVAMVPIADMLNARFGCNNV